MSDKTRNEWHSLSGLFSRDHAKKKNPAVPLFIFLLIRSVRSNIIII